MSHRKRRKPHIGLFIVLGVTLLVADALLLALLFVPAAQDRVSQVFASPQDAAEEEEAHRQSMEALRAVMPGVASLAAGSALQSVTDTLLKAEQTYEAHSVLNVSNIDFARYIADHEALASPDDEDFIAYVHLVKEGIPQNTEVHATDTYVEQVLNGSDAEMRSVLLAELGNAFYQGTPVEGWDTASYNEEEEQAIIDFYADSVFAGDSVMLGFSYHCADNEDPFFAGMRFLAAGSYSIREAVKEDGEFHPLFRGQVQPLWTSVSQLNAGKVFLFFGVNDMSITPKATEQYLSLVRRIEEASPATKIVILSATLPYKQGSRLNGDNLTAFNEIMRWHAAENGWDYVDIATPISDGKGVLQAQYCSDEDLHLTWSAYDVWGQVLHAYAYKEIYGENPPQRETEVTETEGDAEQTGAEADGN